MRLTMFLTLAILVFAHPMVAQTSGAAKAEGAGKSGQGKQVHFLLGRAIDASVNSEDRWIATVIEAVMEFKCAALDELTMISPDSVAKYFPAHRDLSAPPPEEQYLPVGKKLGAEYVGIQKFELGRDKSVFYYLEVTSVSQKKTVATIERTFKLNQIGTELDEVLAALMKEFKITAPRDLARFLRLPAVGENLKNLKALGECIVAERFEPSIDSTKLADEYRKLCERDRSLLVGYFRAGNFFEKIGNYNDAAEALNLLFLTLPEYLPVYTPLCRSYRKSRRYPDAIRIGQLGQKRGIVSSELVAELALTYLAMGKREEAKDAYKQVLEVNPNDPYALLFYARLNNDEKQPKTALGFIDRLLGAKQGSADVYQEQGRSLMMLNRNTEAIAALTKAIELKPQETGPCVVLGDLYLGAQTYDKALVYYDKVLKKEPDNVDLYLKAAEAAQKSGDPKRALSILKEIETHFSNHGGLQREIGLLELAQGDSTRAQMHLEASVRAGAENEQVISALAWIYLGKKDYDKASVMFKRALPLVKDKDQYKLGLAMVHIKKGEAAEAVALIEEVSTANVTFPGINGMLGDALAAKGEKDKALAFYQKERSLGTEDTVLQKKIAALVYETGTATAALAEYGNVVKMGAGGKDAYYRLGLLSLKMKNAVQAKQYFEQAAKKGPADGATYLTIGSGFAALGKYSEALEAYNACVNLDPSQQDVWLAMIGLYQKTSQDSAAAQVHLKLYALDAVKYQKNLAVAGELFEKIGDTVQAKKAYYTLIAKKYPDTEISRRLAVLEYGSGNTDAVVKLLEGIPLKELNASQISMLAEAYFAKKSFSKVIPLTAALLAQSSKNTRALEMAALSNDSEKNYKNAQAFYKQYINLVGSQQSYAYRLGELYELEQQNTQAILQYRANCKSYPEDYRNFDRLARLYAAAEDWKRAGEVVEKALTFKEAAQDLQGILARVNMNLGKKKEALGSFEEYVKSAPKDSSAHLELGNLYFQQERYADAAVTLQKASALLSNPGPELFKTIGIAYLEVKDTAKAVEFLEKARSLNPQDTSFFDRLYRCYDATKNSRKAIALLAEWIKISPEQTELRVQLAGLYIKDSRFREATVLLEDALKKRKCDVSLHLKLAEVYEKQNNQKQWLAHLQSASECDPKDAEMLFQIARYYSDQRDVVRAEDYLVRVLRIEKRHAAANYLLGMIYLKKQDYKSAANFLSRAVFVDPDNELYRVGLAEAYYRQDRYDNALKAISPLVKKDPIRPEALRWAGLIYLKMGSADTARQILEGAIAADKNCSECMMALGDLYFEAGDLRGAIKNYETALSIGGYREEASLKLAQAYMKTGKENQAKQLYETVLSKSPTNGEPLYRLVHLNLSAGQLETVKNILNKNAANKTGWYFLAEAELAEAEKKGNAAMASYAKALKLIPDVSEVQAGCGRVSLAKQKYAAAIMYFGRAMAGDPENVQLMLDLGKAYEGSGDVETATDLYKEVARVQPSHPEVHYCMARINSKQKDHAQAIENIKVGIKQDKKNAMLYMALGHEYRVTHDNEAALKAYETAAKLDEVNGIEAYRYMGNIYYKKGDEKKAKKYYEIYIKRGGQDMKVKAYLDHFK